MPAPTTVTYRRDLLGRVIATGDAANPALHGAWTYRADGSLATETLGTTGGTRTFTYDALGRPTGITEAAQALSWSYRKDGAATGPYADGNISAETVSYNASGFAAGATPPAGSTVKYAYDAYGRLTGATSTSRPALDQAATYDGDGNLATLAMAGTTQSYAYTAGTNRLSAAGGQSYTHDIAGRVTAAAGTALVRDPATGQVRKATKGATTIAFLYGPSGRQVLATSGTTRRLQVRDGSGAPLAEYEAGTGAPALAHVHGATGRIALWAPDQLHAISKDLRGSTPLPFLWGGWRRRPAKSLHVFGEGGARRATGGDGVIPDEPRRNAPARRSGIAGGAGRLFAERSRLLAWLGRDDGEWEGGATLHPPQLVAPALCYAPSSPHPRGE